MSYDRAITVFSPDGHLFQVEYAIEAVRQGTTAVAVRGADVVILAVEKKSAAKLQVRPAGTQRFPSFSSKPLRTDLSFSPLSSSVSVQEPRTVRKILKVDAHLALAFAGLTADARVLVNKARIESQSYRLTVEDACSVEHMARHIARIQQKYTQRGGRRPFGISILLAGHDRDGSPHLYQTDPSGTYNEWMAGAIGRSSKSVVEYLEKKYEKEAMTEAEALHLSISALLEVVESGGKNIEVGIVRRGEGLQMMEQDKVDALSKTISEEKEKQKEGEEKKSE